MAADFNKPTVTSPYTSFPAEVRDLAAAIAKGDYAGASNIPTGAIQLDQTNHEWEKYNGSTYDPIYFRNLTYGVTTAGTSSAYTLASISPALPTNLGGEVFWFYAHTTCVDSPTLSISGNTARGLYDITGKSLLAGQIQSGQRVGVIYDETNNRWVVITPLHTGPFTYTPTGSSDTAAWPTAGLTIAKADYFIELQKITVILELYGAAASSPLQLIASLPVPCVAQNHRGACSGTDTNGSRPYNIAALYAVNNGGINVYKPSGTGWASFDSAGFAGTFVYRRD